MRRTPIISIILMGILFSQVSLSSAAVPWQVGQQFTFLFSQEETYSTVQNIENGLSYRETGGFESQIDLKITSIDTSIQEVFFEMVNPDGTTDESSMDYNSTEFGIRLGMFSANYNQFENNNSFYLSSFYHSRNINILVEPDFKNINDILKGELTATKIIDTYTDSNTFSEHEFTLGDLLDSMKSWSINGASTLEDVKRVILDDTTEYIFEFDLSGLLVERDWKFEDEIKIAIYEPYEIATLSFECKFDPDGVLMSFTEREFNSLELNNATIINENIFSIVQPNAGLDTNALPGFELYLSILGLIAIPVIYRRKLN